MNFNACLQFGLRASFALAVELIAALFGRLDPRVNVAYQNWLTRFDVLHCNNELGSTPKDSDAVGGAAMID
jgi:hypothetical protein